MPSEPLAEIILFNGRVATQDAARPNAQAVAIGAGKILAVGRDADVLALARPQTDRIDLDGRLLLPGFTDSHLHFYEWALKRQGVRLDDLTRLEQLLERIREAAGTLPAGRWIMGQGWNETDWVEARMPDRHMLDRAAPDHPVLLWRCDLHLAVANSAALSEAGITADTPDPPEGRIERDSAGVPTGILRELAINLVRKAVAVPEPEQVKDAFEDAARELHRYGVTGIHDVRLMADPDGADAFRTFQTLDREERLDLRCWVTLSGHRLDEILALGLQTGFGNERLRIGHVKFFCDGGMGARTSWMLDPFLDAGCGMPLADMEQLAEDIRAADEGGLSVMVHAVGDRANRELIRIFESLEARRAPTGRPSPAIPHRIEHVQMIRPEDAARLRNLKLALCMTPANMLLDMNLIDAAVGEKGKWSYAIRPLMETGAPVLFSSDCPVCSPAPLVGIHAAVTRRRPDGTPESGWHPENRVDVGQALRAYTAIPAAVHQRADLGTIAPGKQADLVVLSRDIYSIPPSEFPGVRVDMTFFDGRIVHRLAG